MNLPSIAKKIFDYILDFAFPRTKLEKKLSEITVEDFYSKARKMRHEDKKIITVFSYEDRLVKKAIHSLKFRKNKRFAKIARGSLFEVKHWLRRAYKRDLLSDSEVTKFQKLINELTPKLSAYINSIGKTKRQPKNNK
jgi:hypothetical protein